MQKLLCGALFQAQLYSTRISLSYGERQGDVKGVTFFVTGFCYAAILKTSYFLQELHQQNALNGIVLMQNDTSQHMAVRRVH